MFVQHNFVIKNVVGSVSYFKCSKCNLIGYSNGSKEDIIYFSEISCFERQCQSQIKSHTWELFQNKEKKLYRCKKCNEEAWGPHDKNEPTQFMSSNNDLINFSCEEVICKNIIE